MKQRNILLSLILAATLTISLSGSAFAEDGTATTETNNNSEQSASETQTTNDRSDQMAARKAEQEKRIQTRKAELIEKFKAKQEKRKEKLAGKRLEVCQKRQDRINTLLEKSGERGKNKLTLFQRIEAKVKKFYESKGLVSADYSAAVAVANEKETRAVAAIDAMAVQEFNCDKTDGAKPGGVIREAVTARRDAMKDYRTAIKDLIDVVRQALKSSKSTPTEGSAE